MLQLQEYVLWRLRDTPGQRTLSAFQQQPGTTSQAAVKPTSIAAALPPSPYKQYAAAAAQTHRQPDMPMVSAAYSSGPLALPVDSDTSQARVASAAGTYMLLNTDRGSMQPDWPQLNKSATVAASAADQPLSTLGQFAGSNSHIQPINKPAASDQHRPMNPDPPPPLPLPQPHHPPPTPLGSAMTTRRHTRWQLQHEQPVTCYVGPPSHPGMIPTSWTATTSRHGCRSLGGGRRALRP